MFENIKLNVFRNCRTIVALIFIVAIHPIPGYAIVNMESVHLGEPPEGFSGNVNLGLTGASGNSEQFRTSLSSRLQWYQPTLLKYLALRYSYGESFGRTDQNRTFMHTRRINEVSELVAWELFGQIESNEFARLQYRGLAGGGVRLSLLPKSNEQALFLGLGSFYNYEKVSVDTGTTDSGEFSKIIGNIYVVAKKKLTENAAIVSTTYYQPRFEDYENFRAFEAAALNVGISNNLSLNLTLEIVHNSRPPQHVKQTDTTYSTSLQYQF